MLRGLRHRTMVQLIEVVTAIPDIDEHSSPALTPTAAGSATSAPASQADSLNPDRNWDIYMVFEYIDYDLAGLMDSRYR